MDQDTKNDEVMKRYLDLPEDVQKTLFAPETSNSILEIGKKHGLTIDKIGELADETGLVMLGITPPSEYIKNLVKRLSVNAEKAKGIAEDINQKVFSPIRESLKKIHGIMPLPHPPTPSPSKGEGEKMSSIIPVSALTPSPDEGEGANGVRLEVKTPVSKIPPIFVKKIPVTEPKSAPDIVPEPMAKPTNIQQELEQALNAGTVRLPIEKTTSPYQESKDPYREPID